MNISTRKDLGRITRNSVTISVVAVALALALFGLTVTPAMANAQSIIYDSKPIIIRNTDIRGTTAAECIPYIDNAYTQLQKSAYYNWFVNNYLAHINCVENSGAYPYYFGYVNVYNATYILPRSVYLYDESHWVASNLVHESCHIMQYKYGMPRWGYTAEMQCAQIQLNALKAMGDAPQWEINYLQSLISNPSTNWWS